MQLTFNSCRHRQVVFNSKTKASMRRSLESLLHNALMFCRLHVELFTAGAAAAAVETTSDCGYLADFVTPCFTPQISPPSLIFRNHLPYSIKLYQIENEGDAPRMRRNLGAGSAMNFGAPNSGLWIVTTESGHIETINGQCHYIVEGDGPHDFWFD